VANSLTHFEIYGEPPAGLAKFYRTVFGWQAERMEGVDYWRITTNSGETKSLNGGLTYRAIPDLNGWMLYVQVPELDETVELIKSLGGSVVRPKTAVPRAAWVTIVADPAKNIFGANPIGCAPIFLALTKRYPHSAQRILARKIAAYSFALLAVSLVFGTAILGFFGISLVVIQIAGGLVLAATGWNLLSQKDDEPTGREAAATLEDALEHAFYPLTLPITVGPGCIAIAIALGAHLRREGGPGLFGGIPRHFIAALIGMFLLCVLVMVFYGNADRIVRRLGKSRTSILTRLSAFILFAIGVQIFWNGLSAGAPQVLTTMTTR